MSYTLEITHSFDGENDVELVIEYNYSCGYPQRGPSYDSGGEPEEYPEVDTLAVMVDGREATNDEFCMVQESDRLYQKCVDNAEDYRQKGRDD